MVPSLQHEAPIQHLNSPTATMHMDDLPLELWQTIFEMAAQSAVHSDQLQLMLVSRQVCSIVEFIFYHTLNIECSSTTTPDAALRRLRAYITAIPRRSMDFLSLRVKKLRLIVSTALDPGSISDDLHTSLLPSLSGLNQVSIGWNWKGRTASRDAVYSKILALPKLRVLSIDGSGQWLRLKELSAPFASTSLTHLSILLPPTDLEKRQFFPFLTHLFFPAPSITDALLFKNLLTKFSSLQCVVVCPSGQWEGPPSVSELEAIFPPSIYPQVAVIPMDWEDLFSGQPKHWMKAESILLNRHAAPPPLAEPVPARPMLRVMALYDFEATEADELSLVEDQIVTNVVKASEDWWWGASNLNSGYFPAIYTEEIP
ncbi:hypothetical protein DL96DRAFT_1575192 [Flagelloscypha sp. PMI_526]|nr:hypothetical protein DL96DRAFT_1575192 [Flagelloscypha sp. PMI_526]